MDYASANQRFAEAGVNLKISHIAATMEYIVYPRYEDLSKIRHHLERNGWRRFIGESCWRLSRREWVRRGSSFADLTYNIITTLGKVREETIMDYLTANNVLSKHGISIAIEWDQVNQRYYSPKNNDTFEVRDCFRNNRWKWFENVGWCLPKADAIKSSNFGPLVQDIIRKLGKKEVDMDNTITNSNIKERMKKYKDMSAKDKAYIAWREDPSLSSEELSDLVGGGASITKINSWRGGWLKNERIPVKAAWAVIEELENQIEQLEEELEKDGKTNLRPKVDSLTREREAYQLRVKELDEQVEQLKQQIKELEKQKPRAKTIVLKKPDGKKRILKGKRHPAYEDVITLASLRKNIFLPGPAGCGKSFLCEQVATDLKLDFSFINCSAGMSEGHLLGRLLPVGESGRFEYVMAEYVARYENGGLFCADELDASDPNVLLVINTSISNGYMTLPNRPEKPRVNRHKDFVFVGCANTYGRGNDRLYVGRNQLDEATLDRFRIGTIPMDYDSGEVLDEDDYKLPNVPADFAERAKKWDGIEKDLCPDDELRVRMLWYRKKVNESKLERIVSTRFMIDAYDMMTQAEWSHERIDKALFSGWTEDEKNLVRGVY